MAKTCKRRSDKKCSSKSKSIKKRGGFLGDLATTLLGIGRIRGQRYEHWLEERLVLRFKDVDFVNAVRRKFKFDSTNMIGKGQFTVNMMINDVCGRPEEDRDMIIQGANPPIVCSKKTN